MSDILTEDSRQAQIDQILNKFNFEAAHLVFVVNGWKYGCDPKWGVEKALGMSEPLLWETPTVEYLKESAREMLAKVECDSYLSSGRFTALNMQNRLTLFFGMDTVCHWFKEFPKVGV